MSKPKKANLLGIEKNITCPTLALASEGEGETFINQARDFINNISSSVRQLKIFTYREGAGAHCQIDNITLMNHVVYDWLDIIFNHNLKTGKLNKEESF